MILSILHLQLLLGRLVEEHRHQAVAPRHLVYVGGAMADPLASDEDGHRAVELQLDHFAGRGVLMPTQVAQKPARLIARARSVAVAHARRTLDVLVAAHVVNQGHKAMVEHGEIAPQDLLGPGANASFGRLLLCFVCHDSTLAH